MTLKTIFSAIVAVVLAAGCAQTEYVTRAVDLPIPPRPRLTSLSGDKLQCLDDDTYITLVDREQAYKKWGLKMEAILKANNAHADR